MIAAFTVYAYLAAQVDVPRVHPDELRYALAGSSVADFEGVLNRGVRSGFGPVHAALLASVLFVTGDRETAYPLWKTMNVLLFVLSAIPLYLLARRLVTPWWSVLATGLSLAIPSAIYVSVVMTESASFFVACWAMLAIVLAIERPSAGRQLAAVATIAVATATRSQFAVLFAAFVAGLVGSWALARDRSPLRDEMRRLWPTLGVIALGVLAFLARPLVTWSSPSESLGPYRDLWTGYDPLRVAKWTLYHAADLELYLAVVPFAVAPIVLWRLFARARGGGRREGAFALSFVTLNLALLLVAGAFSSLPYGYDRLHDRYLFYVVPLWLIAFVVWLADGLPRPGVALAIGAGVAIALPAILPFRQLANEAGVDTVPGALWVWLETQTAGPGIVSARALLAVFVVGLLAAVVLLPRRLWPALPVAVLAVFVTTSVLAWDRMIGAPEDAVYAGGLDRSWIDDNVPANARVTKLYIESPRCGTSTITRHALFLAEFFNDSVHRAAYIGDSLPDGIPIDRVDLEDGALVLESGDPLVADYVFTQPGIELNGAQVAAGTNANLVLWRVGGPVRVTNARTNEEVRTVDCA
jgi:Dolichyl-phosphate-mannose-protein mannosyltransferase